MYSSIVSQGFVTQTAAQGVDMAVVGDQYPTGGQPHLVKAAQ